jgi:predicted RNA-binding Zn ribbon-like protein
MTVRKRRQLHILYSGVVTGLVAGAQVRMTAGWAEDLGAHDHDVELVVAFLNTVDVEQDTDVLDDPMRWREWATGQGLGPPPVGVPADELIAQVRGVRDALRNAVTEGQGPVGDGAAVRTGGLVRVELHDGVPILVASDPVGAVLAASARLAVLGDWDRVKICPADDCRWAFFDHSRNRSRTWCSMRVCGNRTKARNWRERARLRPD